MNGHPGFILIVYFSWRNAGSFVARECTKVSGLIHAFLEFLIWLGYEGRLAAQLRGVDLYSSRRTPREESIAEVIDLFIVKSLSGRGQRKIVICANDQSQISLIWHCFVWKLCNEQNLIL